MATDIIPSNLRAYAEAAEHRLKTRAEAADYLGLKPQTLSVWASTGRYDLPYIKVGRLVKYRQSDLDEFLSRNTRAQTG